MQKKKNSALFIYERSQYSNWPVLVPYLTYALFYIYCGLSFQALKEEGATAVHIIATHGVFAPEAIATVERFDTNFVKSLTVTNSIPQIASKKILQDKLSVIDISGIKAQR